MEEEMMPIRALSKGVLLVLPGIVRKSILSFPRALSVDLPDFLVFTMMVSNDLIENVVIFKPKSRIM